jgi:HlyD family secretion protein
MLLQEDQEINDWVAKSLPKVNLFKILNSFSKKSEESRNDLLELVIQSKSLINGVMEVNRVLHQELSLSGLSIDVAYAESVITNATLSLNQTAAGARAEDIASARASLASAQLAYENTIVRAPFAGQIGSVSAAVGQQTNSQAGIATIITKDKIAQISLNEIDIVNVKLGQSVDLSFDAIPGEKFKGSVSQIDTIGISTSNVVSFAVKISIPNADERIKSGMSVTAEIIIEGKDNVLTVPSGTIKSEGDKFYVMKLKSGGAITNIVSSSTASSTRENFAGRKNRNTTVAAADADNEKVYVTVGMTNDIDTEILEDEGNTLREGDKVVSKTVSSGAVTTTTSAPSAFSLFGGGNRGVGGGTRAATGR